MRRLADQARLASQVSVPVLLVGEPGTGKKWLARLIHYQGPHRERSFAALDCSRLLASALFDMLFGDRGDCQRGQLASVYLDDPASLPRDLQSRLLERLGTGLGPRLLVGAPSPVADIRAGRAVDELYARLGTLQIEVPPLRERSTDLPVLVESILEAIPRKSAHRWKLSAGAWDLFRRYSWPGNLRELAETLALASRQAAAETIDCPDLPAAMRHALQAPAPLPERGLPLDKILEQVERRLLELALQRTGGNRSRAAELLGIWRPRLNRRFEALGLAVPSPEIEIDEGDAAAPPV
jgi:DNA-binding NtrC family response regulator